MELDLEGGEKILKNCCFRGEKTAGKCKMKLTLLLKYQIFYHDCIIMVTVFKSSLHWREGITRMTKDKENKLKAKGRHLDTSVWLVFYT